MREVGRRLDLSVRKKRKRCGESDIDVQKSKQTSLNSPWEKQEQSSSLSHTHTTRTLTHFSISTFTSNWKQQCAVSLSPPPPTQTFCENMASTAAPSPKQSHLLLRSEQKLHSVNTPHRRGSIENIWKATTQQPWNRVYTKGLNCWCCCRSQ